MAETYEDVQTLARQYFTMHEGNQRNHMMATEEYRMEEQLAMNQRSGVVCFECQGTGHVKRDCPIVRARARGYKSHGAMCGICGGKDHEAPGHLSYQATEGIFYEYEGFD